MHLAACRSIARVHRCAEVSQRALTAFKGNFAMELQDVQELTNFFERKVSAYQVAVQGEVAFDHAF